MTHQSSYENIRLHLWQQLHGAIRCQIAHDRSVLHTFFVTDPLVAANNAQVARKVEFALW